MALAPVAPAAKTETTDIDRATSIFADLADGGVVHMEGHAEFWTPFFGIVKDRFGVPWQISVESEAAEEMG